MRSQRFAPVAKPGPTPREVWSSKRRARFSTGLLGALLLGSAGVAAAGCHGPNGQFYIVHNQVPQEGCTIPADKNGVYQGDGVLDVRVPSSDVDAAYLLFPLLENDLEPAAEGGGVEPNRIALSGFEVTLALVDGPQEVWDFFAGLTADPSTAALVAYQSPWSGSVSPGGGTTAAATNAFPAETARRLRDGNLLGSASARVDVRIRAIGNKLGTRVRSDQFTYPLRICDGCLINSVTACPATGPILHGGICNPGQDALVDCCTNGSDLVCPATEAPAQP